MKDTFKKLILILLVGLGVGALVLALKPWLFSTTAPISEIPVKVTAIQQLEQVEVAPTEGVDDERLIRLTLEAGMAAAMAEDLEESVRFISAEYRDKLGFNFASMRKFLERAYEEFNEPRIELVGAPTIQVKDNQAMVQAKMRLTAIYQGRRNYLLGDQINPNSVLLVMNKSANSWKVSRIEGLRPLGFEEDFLKLLGAQIGLPLTEAESLEKKQFCMPCRQRMAERFGP